MSNFIIVADSCCDLPNLYEIENELVVIPLKFRLQKQDKEYLDFSDRREIGIKEFYDLLRNGEMGKTTQLNTNDYVMELKKHLDKGLDVLAIAFSSGLSGTYNSLRLAIEELKEAYPNRKIIGIDTLLASMGAGLVVDYAISLKKKGHSIDDVASKIKESLLNFCAWFTVTDIDFLRRGGRVSSVSAFVAKTLNINPVMHMDNEGHLIPKFKTVGRKQAIKRLASKMQELYDGSIYKEVFISHGDCEEEANYLKDIIERSGNIEVKLMNNIGPVIGLHSGPGTIAIFFYGKNRG